MNAFKNIKSFKIDKEKIKEFMNFKNNFKKFIPCQSLLTKEKKINSIAQNSGN